MATSAKLPINLLSILYSPTYSKRSFGGDSLCAVSILGLHLLNGVVFGVVAFIQFSYCYFISYVGLSDIKTVGK